jgi:nucleoside 2-deoxyribosyltransferase
MQHCPIWQTPATVESTHGDASMISSPRAGGKFKIAGSADAVAGYLTDVQRLAVTNWLVAQWLVGVDIPELTTASLEIAKATAPPPIPERADRLLSFIARNSGTLGDKVKIDDFGDSCFAAAWGGLTVWSEVEFLLDYLRIQGFVTYVSPSYSPMLQMSGSLEDGSQKMTASKTRKSMAKAVILPAGYAHLENQAEKQKPNQAFVAMWFDASMTEAYTSGIYLGIEDAGYQPIRIDRQEHNEKIDDRIIAEISRSRFVVADFTHGENGMRGGVYYEAGFAHGLKIPVIFTCRHDLINDIHFDTRQYNHITWSTPEELREKLCNRICATVGDGPKRKA